MKSKAILGAVFAAMNVGDGCVRLTVKLTPVTSATRMPMLVNHAVDMECGSTTNTLERQETVEVPGE